MAADDHKGRMASFNGDEGRWRSRRGVLIWLRLSSDPTPQRWPNSAHERRRIARANTQRTPRRRAYQCQHDPELSRITY
jgi:hypothetical protein